MGKAQIPAILSREEKAIFKSGAATVHFEDHGQDLLRFHIKNRVVVGCEPFQAWLWVGYEVASFPRPGEQLQLLNTAGQPTSIKYPVLKVVPLEGGA